MEFRGWAGGLAGE
jgi:hypothetical protein